jgi:RNA polymerase-binding protein DksA
VKKAPAKKAPVKKAAVAKKAPVKKAAPAAKSAAVKKAAPVGKKAPAANVAATQVPAKKAAPASKKTTATKASAAKTASAPTSRPTKKAATNTTAQTTATKTAATKAVAKKAATKKAAAKTPRTKTPAPSSFPVLPGEKPWTKAEVDEVLSDLHDDRARVIRTLTAQEEELAGLMRDAGDGAGHDQADMGATSFERDQELTVVNNEREKLAQIDRALARIADGTYGICESCGNPIGKGRAMAFPRATLCLTCKQREERR